MIIGEAPVVRMEDLAGDYFLLGLDAPAQAAQTRPGHFFMLGAPAAGLAHDPLLNRPISALDVRPGSGRRAGGDPCSWSRRVGRGTRLLGRLQPGDRLLCHGPLGRPFPDPPAGARLVLVGGGVGIAPLYCCARAWGRSAEVSLFYGGRTAAELPLAGAFRETGIRAGAPGDGGRDPGGAGPGDGAVPGFPESERGRPHLYVWPEPNDGGRVPDCGRAGNPGVGFIGKPDGLRDGGLPGMCSAH